MGIIMKSLWGSLSSHQYNGKQEVFFCGWGGRRIWGRSFWAVFGWTLLLWPNAFFGGKIKWKYFRGLEKGCCFFVGLQKHFEIVGIVSMFEALFFSAKGLVCLCSLDKGYDDRLMDARSKSKPIDQWCNCNVYILQISYIIWRVSSIYRHGAIHFFGGECWFILSRGNYSS